MPHVASDASDEASAAARPPRLGSAAEPLIALSGIRKVYSGAAGDTEVLRGISLTVQAGEFVALVGPSGSGKSTLLNILGCLDRPSAGRYFLAGEDVAQLDGAELARLRRQSFGFVFQQYHLIPGRTVLENVELPALYAGVPVRARRERARQMLERLGLGERLQHRPVQLSGGQQQRVSLARALINGGGIIFADEPTGALDRRSGSEVMDLLEELWKDGHTIVLITHDQRVARAAERVIELRDGEIVSDRNNRAPEPEARAAAARVAVGAGSVGASGRPRNGATQLSNVREAFRVARQSLRANPARTALTLLGIVVGTAAVVALLAIAAGARDSVLKQLAVFGTNRLYVSPGAENVRGPGGKLTAADADLIRDVPNVTGSMPYLKGKVTVRYGNVDARTNGVAVTHDFPRILNWGMERGTFFTHADEQSLAPVTVLGQKVAKELFPPGVDPIERFVLVENVPFQVIGLLAGKGALSGDADDDDTLVFPFETGSQRIFGTPYLSWISVQVGDITRADATVDAITQVLSEEHHAKDFDVFNKAAAMQAETQTVDVMTSLLGFTAAISLAVGGIGVMNIMLMTVVERTREIGIRLASGARSRDILCQFASEALVLAAVGGAIGVLFGLAAARGARFLGFPTVYSLDAVLQAFVCALTTGAIFGLLPALRAARLEPVRALGRE